MTLTWSVKRAWAIVAVGCLPLAWVLFEPHEALWQRLVACGVGIACILYGAARRRRVGEPVLTLDSSGLRDKRLTPVFLPRSAIHSISFEPSYWAGGALLIQLSESAPEVQVRDHHFSIRGRESRVRGSEVRLSLDGLAFSSVLVREALLPYSSFAAA